MSVIEAGKDEDTECPHSSIPEPTFDEAAAKEVQRAYRPEDATHEIRKRWPRTSGCCAECASWVVKYASYAHCLYGDW